VYKALFGLRPKYIDLLHPDSPTRALRSSDQNHAFSAKGPKLCNSLPFHLRSSSSLFIFHLCLLLKHLCFIWLLIRWNGFLKLTEYDDVLKCVYLVLLDLWSTSTSFVFKCAIKMVDLTWLKPNNKACALTDWVQWQIKILKQTNTAMFFLFVFLFID